MSTPTMSTAPTQQSQPMPTTTIERIKPKDWSGEHKTYNLLEEDNWQSWCDDITLTFGVCGLNNYVNGTIQCWYVSDPILHFYDDWLSRWIITYIVPCLLCSRLSWSSLANDVMSSLTNAWLRIHLLYDDWWITGLLMGGAESPRKTHLAVLTELWQYSW